MFILDTDLLGILQRQTRPVFAILAERMADFSPGDFYVTIVSFHEQVAGWNTYLHRAKDASGVVHAYRMFQDILSDFAALQVLPFDEPAARRFDSLRQQRVRIGTMDLRIAATAIARGYRLLSRNLVDFHKVPGLLVEDWTIG